MKRALLVLALCVLSASAGAAEPALPAGYAVHASLPLDPATNGMEGSLQILEDARITPALRQALWGQTNDVDLVLPPKDPLRARFDKMPPVPAHLRLVDGTGKVITDQALDVPLAEIDRQQLHDGPATVLVLADRSVGLGSYAGIETTLMTVDHGQLVPEPLPGRKALSSSLKNGWKIVDETAADGKSSAAIQVVTCHPNFANPDWAKTSEFVVDLTTYRYADGTWHDAVRSFKGYWESDGDWPDDQFP